jgi:hypothetical protein
VTENQTTKESQLIEIIENQIEDGNPAIVKETLIRLMMSGSSRQDTIEMMACALSLEVYDIAENDNKFNLKRYTNNLRCLPDLGFMEE